MTVNEILTLVNFIINKEVSGDALVPDSYNSLLKEVNISLFNEYWGAYIPLIGEPMLQYVLSDSPLSTFIEKDDINCTKSTGQATLPTDIIHLFSIDSSVSGLSIDIITPYEAYKRKGSVLSIPAKVKPFGFIQGSKFQAYPFDQSLGISSGGGMSLATVPLNIVYLRLPVAPFYDYCQSNTSLKRVFMPEDSVIVEITVPGTRYDLYLDGVAISTDVTKTGVTSGGVAGATVYTSLTNELEWKENTHTQFISRILSKVGINLSEPTITQYAEQLKKTEP